LTQKGIESLARCKTVDRLGSLAMASIRSPSLPVNMVLACLSQSRDEPLPRPGQNWREEKCRSVVVRAAFQQPTSELRLKLMLARRPS
ncbi:hypothetical protein Tco_0584828, partial [Tanacetum coccineum]